MAATHWVIFDDDEELTVEADHFAFEAAHVTFTRWTLVLLRPREVVIRRLPLRGARTVRGVVTTA